MYGLPSPQENSELERLLNSLLEEPPHKTALQNEKVGINLCTIFSSMHAKHNFWGARSDKQEEFLKGVKKYEANIEAMRYFVQSSERQCTLAKQTARQNEV